MRALPTNPLRDRSRRHTRLALESLEDRQLMAVAISPSPSPSPTGPVAVLPVTVATANVSDDVVFSGNVSGSAVSGLDYRWDFGDGTVVHGIDLKNPAHAYKTPGNFGVNLTITDAQGNAGPTASENLTVAMAPIPELALWNAHMITYGKKAALQLAQIRNGASPDSLLGATYYDAERTFYQIASYTHDTSWLVAAQDAETIYRDNFVNPNNGQIPGYWIFAKGLLMDYQQTGDVSSRDALLKLSSNGAFAPDSTPSEWTSSALASREVAYNIMSELAAESVGAPHRDRLNLLVDQALDHIDQWFVSKTADYVQPFMVGLTMDALIQWYDKTNDPRVPLAIKTATNALWSNLWDPVSRSFVYVDKVVAGVGGPTPAADLNLLIAPAYAWMYHQTGDVNYRNIGDQVFAGGVDGAWLDHGKQFDQNYKWSFDYINWRTDAPLISSPAASNTGPKMIVSGAQNTLEGRSLSLGLGSLTDLNQQSAPWTVVVNWGDGTPTSTVTMTATGRIPNVPHTYSDHGVFSVTQTLVSANGETTSQQYPVTVGNVAPTASQAQGPYATLVGLPLILRGAGTDPGAQDQANLVYTWNFGDGSAPVSGINLVAPSHNFNRVGTFQVSLSVTDRTGAVSNVASSSVTVADAPVPELARWEANMLQYGQQMAAQFAQPNAAFGLTDLDSQRVFLQIANYTGDASWKTAANNARSAYRDRYVIPNNGGVTIGWDYTGGLTLDALQNGDAVSRSSVIQLSQKASYVAASTPLAWISDASKAVPVAQGIMTYLDTESLGVAHNTRLDDLVTLALGHLNQWFVTRTATSGDLTAMSQTFQALIRYQEKTGDLRILPALQNAANWLWTNSWSSTSQAFRPINKATATGFGTASPIANLAIAPLFAWIYKQTGDTTSRDIGDQAFAAGVRNATIVTSRDLNVAYSWSFDYIKWRTQVWNTTQVATNRISMRLI